MLISRWCGRTPRRRPPRQKGGPSSRCRRARDRVGGGGGGAAAADATGNPPPAARPAAQHAAALGARTGLVGLAAAPPSPREAAPLSPSRHRQLTLTPAVVLAPAVLPRALSGFRSLPLARHRPV